MENEVKYNHSLMISILVCKDSTIIDRTIQNCISKRLRIPIPENMEITANTINAIVRELTKSMESIGETPLVIIPHSVLGDVYSPISGYRYITSGVSDSDSKPKLDMVDLMQNFGVEIVFDGVGDIVEIKRISSEL